MKVHELIAALAKLAPQTEIYVSIPTGNYWGNIAIKPIIDVQMLEGEHSKYCESFIECDDTGQFFLAITS